MREGEIRNRAKCHLKKLTEMCRLPISAVRRHEGEPGRKGEGEGWGTLGGRERKSKKGGIRRGGRAVVRQFREGRDKISL